jgi:hypothetical protein
MIELIESMNSLDFAMLIACGLSVLCMWGLFK